MVSEYTFGPIRADDAGEGESHPAEQQRLDKKYRRGRIANEVTASARSDSFESVPVLCDGGLVASSRLVRSPAIIPPTPAASATLLLLVRRHEEIGVGRKRLSYDRAMHMSERAAR